MSEIQETRDFRARTLFLIALTSSLGFLSWGYSFSITNAVVSNLQNYVFPSSTPNQISFFASALVIGATVGSYFSGKIVSNFGRRKSLLLGEITAIIGALLCIVQSLPVIVIGRFILGLVIGVNSTTIPLYNVEMAPVKLKGIISSVSVAVGTLGIMLSFAMSFFVPTGERAENSQVWRVLLGFPILFNVARIFILMRMLKFETPLYLALQEKMPEARAVLEIIYTHNIDQHMEKVVKDKEAVTSSAGSFSLKDLLTPKYRRAFLIGLLIAGMIQLSGFSPIFMFFNLFVAESANNDPSTLALFSTLFGLASFSGTVITTLIVEKLGRRPLLVYGTLFLFINLVLYILVRAIDGPANGSLKYIIVFWPIFYRLSTGTLGFVYISELLPTAGVAFTVFVSWVMGILAVQTLLPMASWIGVQGLMFLYAGFALFGYIVFQKYLIETKGRTKAELLELYRASDSETKYNDIEMQKVPLLPTKSR